MLKMSTTFSKTRIHPFYIFRATLWSVSGSMLATVCSYCVSVSTSFVGYSNKLFSLINSYKRKSGGARSGDRCGQRPRPTMRSPENSRGKTVAFAVWAVAPSCWNQQSLSFSSTCFRSQILRVSRDFISRHSVVLFDTSSSGCALLNALWTATNDFNAN
jgi:hypothetical protein